MVPFGMRLLLAELPQNLNRPHEAIDRLSRVLFVVRKILRGQSDRESVAARLWQRREVQVLHSIVNCAILQKVIFKFPMHSYRCNSKFQNMYPGFFWTFRKKLKQIIQKLNNLSTKKFFVKTSKRTSNQFTNILLQTFQKF